MFRTNSYNLPLVRDKNKYGVTLRYPNGRSVTRHAQARAITNTRSEHNIEAHGVSKARARIPLEGKRVIKFPGTTVSKVLPGTVQLVIGDRINKYNELEFIFSPRLGTYLGSGAYGSVLMATYANSTLGILKTIRRRSMNWVDGQPPLRGATICVKLSGKDPVDTEESFVTGGLREAACHAFLSKSQPVFIPGLKPISASDFVPVFHRSGMVHDKATSLPFFVTVMGMASGQTLDDVLRVGGGTLSAEAYVHIEQAMCALWLHGIAHGDFHGGNVFYNKANKKATVIDFGFCTILNPHMVKDLRQKVRLAIANGVRSLGEVWSSHQESKYGAGVQGFVNRVQYKRNPGPDAWYNPDGHALKTWYDVVPRGERKRIPILRQEVWGFVGRTRSETVRLGKRPASNEASTSGKKLRFA